MLLIIIQAIYLMAKVFFSKITHIFRKLLGIIIIASVLYMIWNTVHLLSQKQRQPLPVERNRLFKHNC